MDETEEETGPILVETENWDLFKDRWREAADLYESGDVAGTVFRLKRLAGEGFTPAFSELGDKYEFGGEGIEIDLAQAVEWYTRSIEAVDDVRSHIGLARIYLHSEELDPDKSLAFHHLQILADTDVMAGWFGLGFAYQRGLGTAVDLNEAEVCFRKAIDKGHLVARAHLMQVLMAQEKPGWFKMALRYLPGIWLRKKLTPHDPRLGFEYEPVEQKR